LGVVLGLGLAFVVDRQDDHIKSAADVQQAVDDLPVLTAIPKMRSWRKRKDAVLATLTDPTAPEIEAYWSLRASLKFLAREGKICSVVVTSPTEGEGKTTTVANLGVVLAQSGERTVVVSCDLRRPRLGSFFNGTRVLGLTSVLLGEVTLNEALSPVKAVPNLWLLDTGPLPPNPHRALADTAVQSIFQELTSMFDIVIVDSPPLLPVADALALGQISDTTIVVTSFGSARKRQLRLALEMLETAHISVAGVILNEVPPKASSGYADYYGYGQDSKRQAAHRKGSIGGRGSTRLGDAPNNGSVRKETGLLPQDAHGHQGWTAPPSQAEAPG
jgi:capsular exopolysaccharide synthesis family protein